MYFLHFKSELLHKQNLEPNCLIEEGVASVAYTRHIIKEKK